MNTPHTRRPQRYRVNPRFALWLASSLALATILIAWSPLKWWGIPAAFGITFLVRAAQVRRREQRAAQATQPLTKEASTLDQPSASDPSAETPDSAYHEYNESEAPTLPVPLPSFWVESGAEKFEDPWTPPDESESVRLLRQIAEALQRDQEPTPNQLELDPALSPRFEELPRWVRQAYPLPAPERVVAFVRVHWLRAVPPVATAMGATVGVWWSYFAFFTGNPMMFWVHALAWASVMVASGIVFLKHYRHVYVWDVNSVVLYRGVFTIRVASVGYSKITDLETVRPLMGRMFGYWNLRVETAGQQQAIGDERFLTGGRRLCQYISEYVNARKQ